MNQPARFTSAGVIAVVLGLAALSCSGKSFQCLVRATTPEGNQLQLDYVTVSAGERFEAETQCAKDATAGSNRYFSDPAKYPGLRAGSTFSCTCSQVTSGAPLTPSR